MNNKEIAELFEEMQFTVEDTCYDDKQADFDYNGCTAGDDDVADWFKPKFKGGKRL